MKFRVDVYSATGAGPIGGPILDVLGVSISEKLNQVGEATISLPASEAAARGLARGMQYRIYHTTLGYLGQFKHVESTVDATSEIITIKAYDSLIALAERVAGFRRNFSGATSTFSAVATSLFNTSMGWTVSYEGGTSFTDQISYSVEGENYLRMADYLRKYIRGWFRREGDTAIRFGRFSTTTPVLTFVSSPPLVNDAPVTQALITQITRTRAGGEVVNRVFPVGAGIGETKLDLSYSNRSSPYTIKSTTIGGTGAVARFLEDEASIATYGAVERVVAWNEIRPVTNSEADLRNAANALYDIASAYLQKYKSENDAYTLSAVNVPASLRVGDLVRIVYNGVAQLETGAIGWLSVASNFYVTDITRSFDERGEAQATIGIAANGEAVIGDTEVLYDILADVQTLKLRTQPTQTYFTKVSDTVNTGGSFWGSDPYTSNAFFIHRFGPEVLEVNEIYLEISTRQWFYAYGLPTSAAISVSVSATNAAQGYVFTSNSVTTSSTSTSFVSRQTVESVTATNQASGAHNHTIAITGGASLVNYVGIAGTGSPYSWETNAGVGTATMGGVSTSLDHNHTQNPHSHNMDHKHALIDTLNHGHAATGAITFGTATPDTVTATPRIGLEYICGTSSGWIELDSSNTTLVENTTGQSLEFGTYSFAIDPSFNKKGVQGYGIIRVNVTNVIDNVDWRNNDVRFNVKWSRGRAAVMTQLYGRVTIQPIAV